MLPIIVSEECLCKVKSSVELSQNMNFFGTHRDDKGQIIHLVQKIFKCAGNNLNKFWSTLVINGHKAVARYLKMQTHLFTKPKNL